MSFEKLNTDKVLCFYYPVDDIFKDASDRSMYRSDVLPSTDTDKAVDKFALSEDEKDIHLSFLEDAVYDVFLNFLKYTSGIDNAIAHNVDYTPAGGASKKTCYIKIVNNSGYNANYIKAVDVNILKALRFYTLRAWLESKGRTQEATEYDNLYLAALRNMKNYSFQLKKAAL